MIKEAIEKVEQMSKPELLMDQWGRWWSTKQMQHIAQPKASSLSVDTLTGLVEYVAKIVETKEVFLFVENAFKVSCHGAKEILPSRQREHYGDATYQFAGFHFGEWLNLDNFIIGLQVMFEQGENTAAILKIVGNLSDSNVTTFSDDGVSQAVAAKVTLTKVENVEIPRILTLAPWRTFREIEQPKSEFIFRMRQVPNSAPQCALFDVGGDLWKIDAMEKIKEYLTRELPEILVIA
jgi:hypothetical protein